MTRGRSLAAGALLLLAAAVRAQEEPLPAGAKARFGTTRFFVPHDVDALRWSDDGKRLTAMGAEHGSVRISCFEASGPAIGTSVTPPGLAAWRGRRPHEPRDSEIMFFDEPSDRPEVRAALSANGARLAVANYVDHRDVAVVTTTTIHELPSGRALLDITTQGVPNDLVLSPDGARLAVVTRYSKVSTYSTSDGTLTALFDESAVGVMGKPTFSPDGARLAVWQLREGSTGCRVLLFDMETKGRKVLELAGPGTTISGLAFSPDGGLLALATGVGVFVLDGSDGRLMEHDDVGYVRSVAFSPDGKTLAWVGPEHGVGLRCSREKNTFLEGVAGADGDRLSFSPDGSLLAFLGIEGAIHFVDVLNAREIGPTVRHTSGVQSVAFSADGEKLAAGTADGAAMIWDTASPAAPRRLELGKECEAEAVAFSSAGDWFLAATDIGIFHRFELPSWDELERLPCPEIPSTFTRRTITSVSFSADLTTVAASGADGSLWIFGPKAPARRLDFEDHQWGTVALSPGGERVAWAGNDELALWDVATGERLLSLDVPAFMPAVALSPNMKLLAVTLGDDGTTVCVFDAADGHERRRVQLHSGRINALTFSPDSARIAAAGDDRAVVLFDAETGREARRFTGHEGAVTSLTFSSDGKALASGSKDQTVLVWDVGP